MLTKEEVLRELNFSEKEINVYLALSVNQISKKSNLNRVTTYDVLEYLLEKGRVNYFIKSGVKYFEAVDPSKLLDELKEKQEKLQQILPKLESIKQTLKEKPRIEQYEGIEGLKSIMNDILKEKKESWFLSDVDLIESLEFYFPHFIKEKRRQKIFSKVISSPSAYMKEYKRKSPKKFVRVKFIDIPLKVTKIIYGNKVAVLTFEEKNSIGIIIENKEIADAEREQFKLLWKIAK